MKADVAPGPGASVAVHADALIRGSDGARHEVDDPTFYTQVIFDPLSHNLPLSSLRAPAVSAQPAYASPGAIPAEAPPRDAATPNTGSWHESPSP